MDRVLGLPSFRQHARFIVEAGRDLRTHDSTGEDVNHLFDYYHQSALGPQHCVACRFPSRVSTAIYRCEGPFRAVKHAFSLTLHLYGLFLPRFPALMVILLASYVFSSRLIS